MFKTEFAVPMLLVILMFGLKSFLNRSTSIAMFIQALYELPADIGLLSLSFITGSIISNCYYIDSLKTLLLALCVLIISIIVWRIALNIYDFFHHLPAFILTIANYFVTLKTLLYVISIITIVQGA